MPALGSASWIQRVELGPGEQTDYAFKQLLKKIHQKPVYSYSLQNLQNQGSSFPPTEAETQGLKGEIERLNSDKESVELGHQQCRNMSNYFRSKFSIILEVPFHKTLPNYQLERTLKVSCTQV